MTKITEKPSKYSEDYLKKLFQYTLGEDIANAVSHTAGAFFGLYALVNLTYVAGHYGHAIDVLSFVFYGLTIFFMFLMSTLYHSMVNHTARSVFKKLDHIAIYILILGSYTPMVFSLLRSTKAYWIYLVMLVVTIVGIIFKSLYAGRFKKVSTLIYVIMGWSSLWVLPEVWHKFSVLGLCFFLIGGLSYTLGSLLYAFARFKYAHMIWHICVVIGVVFQYISITFFILQYR